MTRLYEEYKFVPILRSADINGGVDSDSVDMAEALHCTFLLTFGTHAGATGATIKVYEGATHGTKTTALTFYYRYGSAATGSATSDVFAAAEASSAALTIATATLQNRQLILEVPASIMSLRYLTIEIGDQSDSGVLHGTAILKPRFPSATIATVID